MALTKLLPLLTCLLGVAGCSPTFNWRNTTVPQTPLQASMPCKPEAAARPVSMPGGQVDLHMMACEAAGQRFVLGWMRPQQADADVLQSWQRATLVTLRLPAESLAQQPTHWTWSVPGANVTQTLEVQGQGPQGESVKLRAVYFLHQGLAYQAAIYGARPDRADAMPFFEALRLP